MATVDASGALHGADGRFAGRVAGESTSELSEQDALAYLRAKLGEPGEAPTQVGASTSREHRTEQRARLREMTDQLDAEAVAEARELAQDAGPNIASIRLARLNGGSSWALDGLHDDQGQWQDFPDQWDDIDACVRELDRNARWADAITTDKHYTYATIAVPQGDSDVHR